MAPSFAKLDFAGPACLTEMMLMRILTFEVGRRVDNLDPLSYLFHERISRTCVLQDYCCYYLVLAKVHNFRAIKNSQLLKIGQLTLYMQNVPNTCIFKNFFH